MTRRLVLTIVLLLTLPSFARAQCGTTLAGQPCCSGNTCAESDTVCDVAINHCIGCGDTGQVCCSGNTCLPGDVCVGGRCIDCGRSGQPACPTATPTNTPTATPTATPTSTPTNAPPICSAAAPSASILWPPDHRLVNVSITGVFDPDGDTVTTTITSVTQDEPLTGLGSGDTCPDAVGVGTHTAQLRAERAGTADGRVYHLSFTATDSAGKACTGVVTVCVPHDQSGRPCVDEGPLFNSTGPC